MEAKPQPRTLQDLVSREELCQAFGVSRYVVDRFVDLGLPYHKLGRQRWFFVAEFLEFVRTHLRRQKAGPETTS